MKYCLSEESRKGKYYKTIEIVVIPGSALHLSKKIQQKIRQRVGKLEKFHGKTAKSLLKRVHSLRNSHYSGDGTIWERLQLLHKKKKPAHYDEAPGIYLYQLEKSAQVLVVLSENIKRSFKLDDTFRKENKIIFDIWPDDQDIEIAGENVQKITKCIMLNCILLPLCADQLQPASELAILLGQSLLQSETSKSSSTDNSEYSYGERFTGLSVLITALDSGELKITQSTLIPLFQWIDDQINKEREKYSSSYEYSLYPNIYAFLCDRYLSKSECFNADKDQDSSIMSTNDIVKWALNLIQAAQNTSSYILYRGSSDPSSISVSSDATSPSATETEDERISRFDQHAYIFVASIKEKVVGTCRLIVADNKHHVLELETQFNDFKKQTSEIKKRLNDQGMHTEISRLVIQKNYRRSNVVVELSLAALKTALIIGSTLVFNETVIHNGNKRTYYKLIGFDDVENSERNRVLRMQAYYFIFKAQLRLLYLGSIGSHQRAYAEKYFLKTLPANMSRGKWRANRQFRRLKKELKKLEEKRITEKKVIYDSFKFCDVSLFRSRSSDTDSYSNTVSDQNDENYACCCLYSRPPLPISSSSYGSSNSSYSSC